MKCSQCQHTYKIQRKHGVTVHCKKDSTHMDVTYYTRDKHINEDNSLCPLNRRHIKDSTKLSGGHLW